MPRFLPVLGLLLVSTPAVAADLDAIRNELREVQTSIASVRLVYLQSSPSLTLEYTYLQDGPRIRLDEYAAEIGRTTKSFDGTFGYQLLVPPDASDVDNADTLTLPFWRLSKHNEVPDGLSVAQTPLLWFGLPVSMTGKPLWELLEHATIVGESMQGEWPVVEIDLERLTKLI